MPKYNHHDDDTDTSSDGNNILGTAPKAKNRRKRASSENRKKSLPFTKREIKFLHKGVKEFGMGAWERILKEFDFQEGRTAVSCRKKFLYTQDNPPKTLESESDDDTFPEAKRSKKPMPFTKQEVQWIWNGVQTFGTNWRKILKSYRFQPGRTAKSLEHKYYRHIKKNPPKQPAGALGDAGLLSGKFSDEECQYLMEGAQKYLSTMDATEAWERILREYAFEDGRTPLDLREKYEFLVAQRAMGITVPETLGANPPPMTVGGEIPLIPGMPGVPASTSITPNRRTPLGRSPYGLIDPSFGIARSQIAQKNPLQAHHLDPHQPQVAQKYATTDSMHHLPHDALYNPTPMTPLSPSQVLDEIHIGGTRIPTHSTTSNPSSATTPQPAMDLINTNIYFESIQDDSDYESDYEEYDPTPPNQLPMPTPVAIFLPNPVDGPVLVPMNVPLLPPVDGEEEGEEDEMADDQYQHHMHDPMQDIDMDNMMHHSQAHHPFMQHGGMIV